MERGRKGHTVLYSTVEKDFVFGLFSPKIGLVDGASRRTKSFPRREHQSGSLPFKLGYHPNFSGPVQVLTLERPQPEDDETTTAQTIGFMAELARQDSRHPIVRRAAYAAIANAGPSARDQAAAIHQWIRNRVRFVQDSTLAGFSDDPDNAEVLVRPIDLLTMPQPAGDCDDFSMLAAAMLRAVGIPAAYRTVAAEAGNPNYSHAYVLALLPDSALPVDASHGPYAGWEAKAAGKSRTWPIDPEEAMQQQRRNLSGLGDDDFATVDYGPTDAQLGINPDGSVGTEIGGGWVSSGGTGSSPSSSSSPWGFLTSAINDATRAYDNTLVAQNPSLASSFGLPSGSSGSLLLLLALGIGLVILVSATSKH